VDDLHQLHDWRRVEEVQANDTLRVVDGRRNGTDVEAGGVAREDRRGGLVRRKLAEQALLDLEVLLDGLDDQAALGSSMRSSTWTRPVVAAASS